MEFKGAMMNNPGEQGLVRTPKRVLVVEDEDDLRLATRDRLAGVGYDVIVASDGLSALKELTDHDFDVIITDFRMRPFGGSYWIKFLEEHYSHIKIIVISGFLRPGLPVAFPVLYKPFLPSELIEMIGL